MEASVKEAGSKTSACWIALKAGEEILILRRRNKVAQLVPVDISEKR